MELELYQIDAFARRPFEGNPAAVVVTPTPLPDSLMQRIAAENNLSETAFIQGGDGLYQIRWFTPTVEIDLCGHATLASAHVVLTYLEPSLSRVVFRSQRNGDLPVQRIGAMFALDFPVRHVTGQLDSSMFAEALGRAPTLVFNGKDVMAVYEDESVVRALTPDFSKLATLAPHGCIVTAPGSDSDFVSRAFFPSMGINEDPVTGATHTQLVPYWAKRLGKRELFARQLSSRGGELSLTLAGDRVHIAGATSLYLRGMIQVPEVGL